MSVCHSLHHTNLSNVLVKVTGPVLDTWNGVLLCGNPALSSSTIYHSPRNCRGVGMQRVMEQAVRMAMIAQQNTKKSGVKRE